MVNLSFFAEPLSAGAQSVAVVQNYNVNLPNQPYFSYFTDFLGGNLIFVYVVLFCLILFFWRTSFIEAFHRVKVFTKKIAHRIRQNDKEVRLVAILLLSIVLLQCGVAFVGSQPYDFYTQKSWAYINTKYGLQYLYPLSLISPSGQSVGTVSTIALIYPYPPLLGYIYSLDGIVYGQISPSFNFNAPLFVLLMKVPWILATGVLGLIIYYFSRKKFSTTVSLVLMSLYLFNPTTVFESSLWSQSDAILASFLILAVLCLLNNSKRSMWFFIGLSILTKQTAVVPAAFIAFFAFRQFGIRDTIKSMVFPFACIFLFISPYLFVGYSPNFIFNVSLGQNVFNLIGTTQKGMASWQMAASAGGYNIWPLLTQTFFGASGWGRFSFEYQYSRIFGLSFDTFALFLVLICFGLIIAQSLKSKKLNGINSPIFYLLFLAVFSVYMFFTKISPRYLDLTIPLLVLSFGWIKNRKVFVFLYASLTTVFFISDYAYFTLTSLWQPAFLPNFSPYTNAFNAAMFQFITSNNYITIICSASLCIFIISILFSNYRILFKKL
jgi:hypothetical protein